jgi:hypothetical protein
LSDGPLQVSNSLLGGLDPRNLLEVVHMTPLLW